MWPFDGKTRKRVFIKFRLSDKGRADAKKRGYCSEPIQYRVVRIPIKYRGLIYTQGMGKNERGFVDSFNYYFDQYPDTETILNVYNYYTRFRNIASERVPDYTEKRGLDVSERMLAWSPQDIHGSYNKGVGELPREDGWYWYEVEGEGYPVFVLGDIASSYRVKEDADEMFGKPRKILERYEFEWRNTNPKAWRGKLIGPPSQMSVSRGEK